jgi:CRISPR-associated protein Cst2
MKKISSISVSARVTLNLHSLNNEGNEGNQTLTRQVTVFDESGKKRTVNAISGDMLKHIHSEHLFHIAKEGNLSLCTGCQVNNANRITADDDFLGSFKKETPTDEVIGNAIKKCTIDDVHGILITNNNHNAPIKSKIEFGWLVGVPEMNETENYFHIKISNTKVDKSKKDGANQGQNIFHRPANSGVYAFISNIEASKIGFNEISKNYSIDEDERKSRYNSTLQAMIQTVLKPNGAMISQQFPHIFNFEGAVTLSLGTIPAPTVSPMKSDFVDELNSTVKNLEFLNSGLEVKEFSNIGEFANILSELIQEYEPKKLFES